MPSDCPPLDCQDCGACCFGETPRYVPVTGHDHARLPAPADVTTFDGNRCFMQMSNGRCTALSYDPARGGFTCEVYPDRPEVCRALEAGSPECLAERERKLATAQRLVEAKRSPR